MKGECYNCGHEDFTILYSASSFDSTYEGYTLGRCKACQLVNTIGADSEIISDSYSKDYYRSSSSKFTRLIELILSYSARIRAKKLIDHWRRLSNSSDAPFVLDIGCGRGMLLEEFHELGAITQGIERQEFPHDERRSNIHIGDLSDPYFEGKKYDIIILWHVLEHIGCMESLISAITKHMHRNSILIISVPNFSSFQQGIFRNNWFHLDLPRHLIHLEHEWLSTKLEQHGLIIDRINHLDLVQNCYGFIQSTLNYLSPSHHNELYKMLQYRSRRKYFKFALHATIASLLSPIAVMECIFSRITKQGSTITITSRTSTHHDKKP